MAKKTVKQESKVDTTENVSWTTQEDVEKMYLKQVCENMRITLDLLKKYPEYLDGFMNLVQEMDELLSTTQIPPVKTKKVKKVKKD